ncbi:MAG: hypothetical protein P4L84_14630 [Isosphaeraceae bacterium]|nr:hypothetical protein [Isosphaeraceae bacterium]
MRRRHYGWAVAALLIAFSTVAASAAELSEDRFVDWDYYNAAG